VSWKVIDKAEYALSSGTGFTVAAVEVEVDTQDVDVVPDGLEIDEDCVVLVVALADEELVLEAVVVELAVVGVKTLDTLVDLLGDDRTEYAATAATATTMIMITAMTIGATALRLGHMVWGCGPFYLSKCSNQSKKGARNGTRRHLRRSSWAAWLNGQTRRFQDLPSVEVAPQELDHVQLTIFHRCRLLQLRLKGTHAGTPPAVPQPFQPHGNVRRGGRCPPYGSPEMLSCQFGLRFPD